MKTHTLLALICLSLLTPSLFGQTNVPADSTNAISPFQQAVTKYQQPPNYFSDAEIVAKLSATMDTLPPIPEEARKHFVMGEAIYNAAKDTNDFIQAAMEFYQSCTNAPWFAKAWNNMAVSCEKGCNYDYALNSLKVYQDFKLSDDDARAAQDLAYKIQAEKDLAAKHAADEQAQAVADAANAQAAAQAQAAADAQKKQEYQDKIGFLAGTWNYASTVACNCPINGQKGQGQYIIAITGKNISIAVPGYQDNPSIVGTIEGDDYTSIKWVQKVQGLPDQSIKVTIDKSVPQISFYEMGTGYDDSGQRYWNSGMGSNVQLTQ